MLSDCPRAFCGFDFARDAEQKAELCSGRTCQKAATNRNLERRPAAPTVPALEQAHEGFLVGLHPRPRVSAGGRRQSEHGRVGPAAEAASGSVRPRISETGAGGEARPLASTPAPELAPMMPAAVSH